MKIPRNIEIVIIERAKKFVDSFRESQVGPNFAFLQGAQEMYDRGTINFDIDVSKLDEVEQAKVRVIINTELEIYSANRRRLSIAKTILLKLAERGSEEANQALEEMNDV